MSDIEDFIEESVNETDEEQSEISSEEEQDNEVFTVEHPKTDNQLHKRPIIIEPSKRRTSNLLTRIELTELINIRGLQIAQNPIVLTDITGLSDPIEMAEKELRDKKCPLILSRKVGEEIRGNETIEYVEHWDVNDMGIPAKY